MMQTIIQVLNNHIALLNTLVLVLGVFTALLLMAIFVMLRDPGDPAGLQNRIAHSTFASFLAMIATIIFASASFLGEYYTLSPLFVVSLRLLIFVPAILYETRLLRTLMRFKKPP